MRPLHPRRLLHTSALRGLAALLAWLVLAGPVSPARAQETRIVVQTARTRQVFEGLGVGAIYYEGHLTSLAERKKDDLQEKLYDDLFTRVKTRYLQLMIRETHEPKNDNDDPFTPAFDDKNFGYCRHTLHLAEAALKRRKDLQLYATLHTPPPWMKTNNNASGGGESRATLKPGMELELAEYVWAFLEHMQKNGAPIQYLSIANEPDWPHTQPGYFLSPERHAMLFKTVGDYLDRMSRRYPKVPRPRLVGPNTLSAPGAVKDYLPPLLRTAAGHLEVIGAHDYDPRGDRWGALRKVAGKRSVWVTEWCARKRDPSPGLINSATEYGQALHEAFKGGANVWMAYDWAYPPRESGEALIHINWGNDYQLTKPYFLFRQWAEPLTPGMRVVEVGSQGPGATADGVPGVKPTAFLSTDNRTLVVHIVNTQDRAAPINLRVVGRLAAATSAARIRTSSKEDVVELPALERGGGGFADVLPARSMVTYLLSVPGK